jgi:hypothetical protein
MVLLPVVNLDYLVLPALNLPLQTWGKYNEY